MVDSVLAMRVISDFFLGNISHKLGINKLELSYVMNVYL